MAAVYSPLFIAQDIFLSNFSFSKIDIWTHNDSIFPVALCKYLFVSKRERERENSHQLVPSPQMLATDVTGWSGSKPRLDDANVIHISHVGGRSQVTGTAGVS